MSFFRYDGTVRTVPGFAVAGAAIAVLTQPAVTTIQPGTPLATLYGASTSNAASLTSASYAGGFITFVFSTTPSADVVSGSFISLSGVTPSGYNGVWQVVSVGGNNVTVVTPYATTAPNPGSWSSGGTVATSALPNPLQSDGQGQYFFYASAAAYTVQVYSGSVPIGQEVFADQVVVSPGSGSVTSVGLSMPAEFAVANSPVTSSDTLTVTKANQNANYIYAGPTTGPAAPPTFRALVAADIAGLGAGSVTSVGLSVIVPSFLSKVISNSPVTGSGTLTATITLVNQAANVVFAGPTSGGTGAVTYRALVTADLPVRILSTDAITGATASNIRTIDSETTLSFAGSVTITGSVAAVRGNTTVHSGTTIAAGYLYGTQGKITAAGTLASPNFTAGLIGQLDFSAVTSISGAGPISCIWGDCGASMPGGITTAPNLNGLHLTNTTGCTINSAIFVETNSTYLLDISNPSYSPFFSATPVGIAYGRIAINTPAGIKYISVNDA